MALAFPCSVWSSIMQLVPTANVQRLRRRDRVLVEFAAELAKLQVEARRHFLIENPDQSAAWSLVAALSSVTVDNRSLLCRCHQCRFCKTDAQGVPQKKATRFVTDVPEIAHRLDGIFCKGDHAHAAVIGGSKVTAPAGHYARQLSSAVVDGAEACWERERRHEAHAAEAEGEEEGQDDMGDGGLSYEPQEGQETDDDFDQEPVDDVPVSKEAAKAVMKLHEATGHRSRRGLVRALVVAGASEEILRAARQLRCSICHARGPPKPRRVAGLPRAHYFSDLVHIDLLQGRCRKSTGSSTWWTQPLLFRCSRCCRGRPRKQ